MTLGEKISALRAARGMKQDELAAALGVSRQSVSLLGLYLSFCGALCLLINRDRLADPGRAHTLHMELHKHPHVRRIQPRVL